MRKIFLTGVLAGLMILPMGITAFAAGWKKNEAGWWWEYDNGSWPAGGWQWLDGNGDGIAECYYFDGNGYLLANTTTPDGYVVNGDGAWIVSGTVQTQRNETKVSGVSTGQNGWYQNEAGQWKYRNAGGDVTDFQNIGGKWYFFSTMEDASKGTMRTGFQWIGHKAYYLDPADGGAVATNMDYDGYHFGNDGCAVSEINNPLLLVDEGYPSRIGINDKLMVQKSTNTSGNNSATNIDDATNPYSKNQPAGYREEEALEFLAILNQARAELGRTELEIDENLMEAARIRAKELPESYGHTRPDGRDHNSVLYDLGIQDEYGGSVGENANQYHYDAQKVYTSWYNSDGHRRNMMDSRYKRTGIACYFDPDSTQKYWWVQLFDF